MWLPGEVSRVCSGTGRLVGCWPGALSTVGRLCPGRLRLCPGRLRFCPGRLRLCPGRLTGDLPGTGSVRQLVEPRSVYTPL